MRICQATAGRGDLALSDEFRLPPASHENVLL